MPTPEVEDPGKWRRALVKKIRQVEELLARRERGEVLNERQAEKVTRESSLRSALAAAEAEGAGQQAAPTAAEPASTPAVAATAAAATSAATPAEQGGKRARRTAPDLPSHQLACNHCGRSGHEARGCTFGLAVGENFLFCQRTEPRPCLPRTFIVPLRRAAAAFDPAAPRADGRVDVGLRCASSALFRSQSLRQNTQVTLCFLGGGHGGGEGGGHGGGEGGGPAAEAAAPRLVEVCGALVLCLLWPCLLRLYFLRLYLPWQVRGALVRDLRPDELSLALRLRAVSEAEGAAAAEAEAQAARDALTARTPTATGRAAVEAWSRSATRGLSSRPGGVLDAVRGALESHAAAAAARGETAAGVAGGPPPLLLLLSATGDFISDVVTEELLQQPGEAERRERRERREGGGGGRPDGALLPASSVVVVLGDDRGLEAEEERQVRTVAATAGARVRAVSLGGDMLFASHAIVLVHHYLDRLAHSCLARPPREYARGGGRGARGGRGRGATWGRGAASHNSQAAPPHHNDKRKRRRD